MRHDGKSKKGGFVGAVLYFLLIAAVTQCAVLTYDYIRIKTDNKLYTAILILIVVIMLSVICVVIDAFRRKLTVDKPVGQILEATEKIAEGDFSVRLTPLHPYGKYNEYDVIMENINKMVEELSNTEMLHSDFVSNVSHELKTPLTIIKNYATLLQKTDLSEEDRVKYSTVLIKASQRLSGLVTDILKLNKLENQTITPDIADVPLHELLAQSVIRYEEALEAKGIELVCDIDEVTMRTSQGYLEIVFSNLISNAVKFTESGSVSVKLKGEGDKATVVISDTGCGMSGETGAHIFEKFYQGDTSRASEGNGLGLALVKKVVDILGGEIYVESELGKGTTFTVTVIESKK